MATSPLGNGLVDAHKLAVIRMPRESLVSREDRRWWELLPPAPLQCEVRSLHHRCDQDAKYALTFRGKVGYVCEHDLAQQVVSLTRWGAVQVEKLP